METLRDVCRLQWSPARRVTAADGDCQRVLARPASELLDRPLADVLGVPEPRVHALDQRARGEAGSVEFLQANPGPEGTVLRLCLGTKNGDAFAWIHDMHALLEGAPPLQIGRLASALSHEIRNPLSSVKMAVQTLERNGGLSDRDRRRLNIANREIRTMERMLGLLSEYGRQLPPYKEPVALRTLLQDALASVEQELQERRVRFEFDEAEGVPRVSVDAHRLRLVLAQLFVNVAILGPEDAVIHVGLRPGPPGFAHVTVTDPNIHIRPEERASLFEPFGLMRLTRVPGLSLAALRRVLQSQGGDVSAETRGDGGVLFTLTFPT